MKLSVTVDNHLRFDERELPEKVQRMLWNALTVQDLDEPDIDPVILCRRDFNGQLVIPRGFAVKLVKGLGTYGISVEWDDQRSIVPAVIPDLANHIESRDYQIRAIKLMAEVEQGIYEAPPASGKTIATAAFLSAAQQRSIILVDKINIATQWRLRISDALGYVPGLIGDDVWDERAITVAVRQTLWSRFEYLKTMGWFKTWGAVVLDECHAISADTVRALINEFYAYFRLGLSATPSRRTWLMIVSQSIIGEIFCRTTDEELEEAGVLVRPRVVAVRTPFQHPWDKRRDAKTQWGSMLKKLKFDVGRNNVIGTIMKACIGHTCLVHTDHKGHAHELAAYALAVGWPDEAVLMLTGDQNDGQRQAVIERASEGNCIIFSTIGQEALDIPRLDRFLMPFPTKQEYLVKQMVGRIKRTHESKGEAPILYDFYDQATWILGNQFAERRGVYDREGLDLVIV